jgi:hypothetical protein
MQIRNPNSGKYWEFSFDHLSIYEFTSAKLIHHVQFWEKLRRIINDGVDQLLVDWDTRKLHALPALRDVALCASRLPPFRMSRSPPTPGPVKLGAMRELPGPRPALPAHLPCASRLWPGRNSIGRGRSTRSPSRNTSPSGYVGSGVVGTRKAPAELLRDRKADPTRDLIQRLDAKWWLKWNICAPVSARGSGAAGHWGHRGRGRCWGQNAVRKVNLLTDSHTWPGVVNWTTK